VRLLADENVPRASVVKLRGGGHDVAAVAEIEPGVGDPAVLARAVSESRILLTFDRDYGRLIWQDRLPPPPAIIYCRFAPAFPEEPAQLIEALLAYSESDLLGRFVVIEREGIRTRRFY
jgi:predicted nuclease of predicted toxin-antitoxin system